MKRNIQNKGITLVALVVTLIVLLVLAGITIATLFGENGVINKAQKAKEETEQSRREEQEGLNKTETDMANAIKGNTAESNGWTQPDPLRPEITNGEMTLKIGDYVDYDCTTSDATYTSKREKNGYGAQTFKASAYNYGWRVLGVDKNTKQLQLISEDFVPLIGGVDRGNRKGQYYCLSGQDGYVNGIDELNKICSIYGTGIGATGARIVNVDDIDWITGYNPNNIGKKDPNRMENGTKYCENQLYEYGNTVEYTLLSTGVQYTSKGNNATGGTNTNYKSFTYYDEASKTWKSLEPNGKVTLKCSEYYYYPTTLTEIKNINATTGIASTSTEYKMLFTNSSTGADQENSGNTNNIYYWLGTQFVNIQAGNANFGLRYVLSDYVSCYSLYQAINRVNNHSLGIRPVVTLDSKVILKDSGTMQDGCKLYNITVNK